VLACLYRTITRVAVDDAAVAAGGAGTELQKNMHQVIQSTVILERIFTCLKGDMQRYITKFMKGSF